MMAQADAFADGIEYLSAHVADLQRRIATEPSPQQTLLSIAFETMNSTIEELRVAEEEMRVQNDALFAAHHGAETWRHHYEDLFEAAPDAYLVTTLSGVIEESNRGAETRLGLSKRFLRGKPLASFVPEGERTEFRRMLLELPREVDAVEREATFHPRRQPPFEAALTVSTVRDADGTATHLRWLVRDQTGRNEAEAERCRLMVEGVRDYAIILLDRTGRVLNWNPGAERLLGYTAAEMRGREFAAIFTPEDQRLGVPQQELATAEAAGRADDTRWHQRKDGRRFWASGGITPLRDKAGTLRWYSKVMRDDTARKEEEERMARAYARESQIAATFQRALLPALAEDAFPGLRVASLYEAAWEEAQIGGDFYDAFQLDGGQVALVIGDVSGKGLAAAAHTAEIKYALRAFLREIPDPGRALSRLNSFLHDNQRLNGGDDDAFVILTVMVVHPATGRMTVAAAGAEPPLLLRADGSTVMIAAQGTLLGLAREVEYASLTETLGSGDKIILVTDGITEARRGNDFLDAEGLVRLARSAPAAASPHETGRTILEGARAFAGGSLSDDACLLIAERV